MADENPGILAMFFTDAVRMNFASEEAGRDIFEDREHVKIVIAGDKHSEVVREATDADRFHEVYRQFKAKATEREQIVGTILDAAPFLSPSQRKEMESLNIFTVEQLAALSDTGKQKFGPGANELVAKAQAFLKVAADTGHAVALAAQAERQTNEIVVLKEQIRDLASKLEASVKASGGAAAPGRRCGPPRVPPDDRPVGRAPGRHRSAHARCSLHRRSDAAAARPRAGERRGDRQAARLAPDARPHDLATVLDAAQTGVSFFSGGDLVRPGVLAAANMALALAALFARLVAQDTISCPSTGGDA